MNLSKIIEISKSSLVGLKVELLKKQEEIKRIKELQKEKPVLKLKKTVGSQKPNEIEDIKNNGIDSIKCEDEFEAVKKSREILEAKSRLYDKLKNSCNNEDIRSKYMVNFGLKNEIDEQQGIAAHRLDTNEEVDDEDIYNSDTNCDSEDDWVDFVDTLGRSRRCLRKDLPEMKAKDIKLAASLQPPTPPLVPEISTELLSWDMQRELMRKKWEDQETVLLGKKDIHYQDVRFDEARPHGVGYFEFSVNEEERIKQQQSLKNLRNQTIEQQEAALGLKVRREQQLQARVAAARRRKRERLGLPVEEDEPQEIASTPDHEGVEHKEENIEDLKETINKITTIRPWDIGKQDVNNVMTQEEWIDQERQKRLEEFAPLVKISEIKNNKDSVNRVNVNCLRSEVEKCISTNSVNVTDKNMSELYNSKSQKFCKPIIENNNGELSYNNTFLDLQQTSEKIDILLVKAKEKGPFSNRNQNEYSIHNHISSLENRNERVRHDNTLKDQANIELDELSTKKYGLSQNGMENHKHFLASKIPKLNVQPKFETTMYSSMNMPLEMLTSENQQERQKNTTKRKWAEIAPPASMSYFNDTTYIQQTAIVRESLEDSIEVGLKYLKTRVEEKGKKSIKGLLDII